MDKLTLTIRLHDPAEKDNAAKSTAWVVAEVDRADLILPRQQFLDKYVTPAIEKILNQLNS